MYKTTLRDHAVGPLKDLKILDLSRLIAGNFLTFYLADLGAEVIKIEDPKRGDPLRHFSENGVANTWKIFSRNKKSIAINLKSSEGQKIVLALVRSADALVENFKPGGLEKLGLAPEKLHEINPNLIIVRISGWGQTGPYSHKPGFGTLIEAFSGFAAKSGFPDSDPLLPNLGLADMITGIVGAYSLMVALRVIEVHGGKGQIIDLSLLESMISFLGADPAVSKVTGKPIPRCGNASTIASPRNIYKTRDNHHVALSASMQSMAERLFEAIGRSDLIDDPKYRRNADRVKHNEALNKIVGAFIAEKSLQENLDFFDSHDITAGPVNDSVTVLRDSHIKERRVYIEVDDPDVGAVPMPNVVPRFSNTPGAIRALAPSIGQHTKEILSGLQYSESAIQELSAAGVIK